MTPSAMCAAIVSYAKLLGSHILDYTSTTQSVLSNVGPLGTKTALCSVFALCAQTAFIAPADVDPVVDVGYAQYRGNLTYPDSVAYLGLPYAEPPLGNLRFRAPVPLNVTRIQEETGDQIVDATKYPQQCVQGSLGV